MIDYDMMVFVIYQMYVLLTSRIVMTSVMTIMLVCVLQLNIMPDVMQCTRVNLCTKEHIHMFLMYRKLSN